MKLSSTKRLGTKRLGTKRLGTQRPGRGKIALSAALGGLALGLAACSSGGGATSAASPANSGTGPTKITVGITTLGPDQTPFFAAVQQGLFKKAGLDVTWNSLAGGDLATDAAINQGSIDLAVGGAIEWISDLANKGISGKIIGEITDQNYDVLAGKGITSVSQLKGKTIGISANNGGDAIYLQAVLAHYGITKSDVSYLAVGNPTSRLSALDHGSVAAIELPITDLPPGSGQNIVLSAKQSPVTLVSLSIFASSSFLASDGSALKKFMTALGEGATWVRNNPQAAVSACQLSGSTAGACQATISTATNVAQSNKYTWSATGAVNLAGIESTIKATSLVTPAVAGLTASDIVDSAVAGAAP